MAFEVCIVWGRQPWWDGTVRCADGMHQIWTGNLLLRTLMSCELSLATAGASDSGAQRWLGWRPDQIVPPYERKRLLAKRARHLGAVWRQSAVASPTEMLAIDPVGRRYAGLVSIDPEKHEMGGWLAPDYRGRGLGAELFAAGAWFGHRHLGLSDIWAGIEPANVASGGALRSAGFRLVEGPPTHTLPDRRIVPAAWFHHGDSSALACEEAVSDLSM